MRILITGGAGFIGVNAAREFLKAGDSVTILDNFFRKGSDVNADMLTAEFPAVKVVHADVTTDHDVLAREVAQHDGVLHLAAQVAVTTSITDPRKDFNDNILGTFNVLEAIRQSANKPAIIYTSTNKVYGALEHWPVHELPTRYAFDNADYEKNGVPETEHLDFHSPYGCSKGAADAYVVDYARIYGLKTLVFRQSCIYGLHQFGVEDQGWVAWFTIAAMQNRPLTIYGTGKQVRDVLFVEDLAKLYRIGFTRIESVSGKAYNIGGGPGNTLSLLELMDHLKQNFGYAPTPTYSEVRPGDQPIFVADVRAVERDLGWKPTTDVASGIGRMHAWLIENKATVQKVLGF